MIRVVIDIEEYGNVEGTREAVAMRLEDLGSVRVVAVYTGKENK